MRSKIKSSAAALSAVLALTLLGACAGDEEAPKASAGSQSEDSEPRANRDSGHPGSHEDNAGANDDDDDDDANANNDNANNDNANKDDKDDEDEDGAQEQDDSQVIRVDVSGGDVTGVGPTVDVAVGERVALEVTSDTDDEVHVHGYDVMAAVSPSKPAKLGFVADLPGAWEVELENAGMLLFELRVQ